MKWLFIGTSSGERKRQNWPSLGKLKKGGDFRKGCGIKWGGRFRKTACRSSIGGGEKLGQALIARFSPLVPAKKKFKPPK